MPIRFVPIGLIQEHPDTQTRPLDQEKVNEYAELMQQGVKFPPLTVRFDGKHYWISDGRHRLSAIRLKKGREAEVKYENGNAEDAIWDSCAANKTHGIPRTIKEKQEALIKALHHKTSKTFSLRQIADHCGVTHSMANKWKKKLEEGTLFDEETESGNVSTPQQAENRILEQNQPPILQNAVAKQEKAEPELRQKCKKESEVLPEETTFPDDSLPPQAAVNVDSKVEIPEQIQLSKNTNIGIKQEKSEPEMKQKLMTGKELLEKQQKSVVLLEKEEDCAGEDYVAWLAQVDMIRNTINAALARWETLKENLPEGKKNEGVSLLRSLVRETERHF